MKKLQKLIKNHKHLVFLDFEGTQFSHEMIAIGAVAVSLDRNDKIKKMKKPFKIYVKAKNKIGKYVVELTGITEDLLKEQGVSFSEAMEELKKYCGLNFKKSSFLTFGNHDLRILNQSIAYSMSSDLPKEICATIQKNYVDYAAFLSDYIRDSKGNPLSLIHYCEFFGVKEAGQAHDPSIDAINLANLYNAFLENKTSVVDAYMKVLEQTRHFPEPVAYAVKKLASGEDVSAKEFEEIVRNCLD